MFLLTEKPIDTASLHRHHQDPKNGTFLCFEGLVRADRHANTSVNGLYYHAEQEQCAKEGSAILDEAKKLFPIGEAVCVQRIGQLNLGDVAVWIGVWAPHRDEAYKASRHIIEEIKKRLLIWKKESLENGGAKWVHGAQTIGL